MIEKTLTMRCNAPDCTARLRAATRRKLTRAAREKGWETHGNTLAGAHHCPKHATR